MPRYMPTDFTIEKLTDDTCRVKLLSVSAYHAALANPTFEPYINRRNHSFTFDNTEDLRKHILLWSMRYNFKIISDIPLTLSYKK